MNRALRFVLCLTAAVTAGSSHAAITIEPAPRYAGHVSVDLATGASLWSPAPESPNLVESVYDNLTAPLLFGISSTHLDEVWGDSIGTAGLGWLDEVGCTIFNSSTSAGVTGQPRVLIRLRNAGLIGGTLEIEFQTPVFVPPGYFVNVTVSNLSGGSNPYAIDRTGLIVEQSIISGHGAATSLGVVSRSPPAVGSSPPTMYMKYGANGPGFYTFPDGVADLAFRLRLDVTSPAQETSWGRVKRLYR